MGSRHANGNDYGLGPKPAWFSHLKERNFMDTTQLIILIVVLVLLFGGGGGYFWSRRGR
jgi:hypothetical protein